MFKQDIAQLVRSALQESGCDPSLLGALDNHSTIALDLHDLPSIHVAAQDDDVWLWATLTEHGDAAVAQRAPELLALLMQDCGYAQGGRLQLALNEGALELRALVRSDRLEDGRAFSDALHGFFDSLERCCETVLR
ncbi:SPI-1 type III secretion system chaperone SpaK [Chromobacterium violaceum]|uniref:SPI-1 type III secretion system chaperone SpaK n=1 Tax=Chromobacterium violaceum TaxID=536 RepID=UPI0009D9C663|nr:SPI-1 type III secretion system chaperone SpaK [Chromobacterium violaceum]MBP4049421.1 SPI-1 type III secretion system chaperone SpaK [Chromobacterium violaceum]OQS28882.1 type III secretion system chaperone SpaK [Chromobacterium violaceum]